MRGLIWLIVLFAIAVGVVMAAQAYSGHVYIVIDQTQTLATMSLHFFVAAVVVAVAIVYLLFRLLDGILAVPGRLGRFGRRRREHQAAEALNQAGLAFFEGKFQQAEKQAAKVLDNAQAGDRRILALMLAAHSADQAGDAVKRAQYLQQLSNLPHKNQLARHLLLAESALNRHDYPAAQASLNDAAAINPKLTRLVRLQLRQAFEQNQALEVLDKVGKLEKAAALNPSEAQQYREWAYRELIAAAPDYAAFKACLNRIPQEVQEGEFCETIAAKLVALAQYPRAIKWVKQHYPRSRDGRLLPHMMEAARYLDEREQQKIMDTAESWRDAENPNAELLLNLGQMAYTQKLWGKAQSYLDAAVAAGAPHQARLLLAKVLDEAEQPQAAQKQRQQVLAHLESEEAT